MLALNYILPGSVRGPWDAFLRLFLAAVLGGIIGLDRERRGRSAGIRTQFLVSLGAGLAMIVSLHFAEVFASAGRGIQVDPARVAYGVMGGVGFLGAGAIIHYGADIRGLTTAASLWCSAAVGLAAGLGMWPVAAVATGVVVLALVGLSCLERILTVHRPRRLLVVLPEEDGSLVEALESKLREAGAEVVQTDQSLNRDAQRRRVSIRVSVIERGGHERPDLAALLESIPEVLAYHIA